MFNKVLTYLLTYLNWNTIIINFIKHFR